MTVAELIDQLRLFPQGLEVQMTMNMEYQEVVHPHFFRMETEMPGGKTYVVIDNWAPKEP
jgi:hypothetical protein